ncbi:transposase [Holotrichia oblita]|uniref:Transposase n=1 Tax=Holotrichia oblita TaxID=644536 RepID=A0ACB9TD77_HOLOL|nr:transposase [Holotrichia oblita]
MSRVLRRFVATGSNARRPGQGCARVTTPDQDRFLRMHTLRQRVVTNSLLQYEFLERYNGRISQNTVQRRFTEANLRPRSVAPGPLLTAEHRRQRLNFGREHINWNMEDWSRILFTDEFRCTVDTVRNSGESMVVRADPTKLRPSITHQLSTHFTKAMLYANSPWDVRVYLSNIVG